MVITPFCVRAMEIFSAAIEAVKPAPRVKQAIADPDFQVALKKARNVIVVGGGKAGSGMVEGVESALADRIKSVRGIVNIPDNQWRPTEAIGLRKARPIGVNEPTAAACVGTEGMLSLIGKATRDDLVLVLLSGGGSALLPALADTISLADKIIVTRLLSGAGATIQELNCVRKHLSRIKGGRLAEAASRAASVWSLIISDVIGNPLDVIASGPTAPDPTTFGEALAIIHKYRLVDTMPRAVIAYLEVGAIGLIPETPKSLPDNVHNRIIASNADALAAAKDKARSYGYEVINLGEAIDGDTSDAAHIVATYVPEEAVTRPLCVLLGGETTVALGSHPGKGGRNQEFVLALAMELEDRGKYRNTVTILSGGTDGEDGPTDAAGAVWDTNVANESVVQKLDPKRYLKNHDSYNFFRKTDGLIKTGLTGTNVMDVRIVLIDSITH